MLTVPAGGRKLQDIPGLEKGAFYAPTVLTDVPEGSPASGKEELFGPVAALFRSVKGLM